MQVADQDHAPAGSVPDLPPNAPRVAPNRFTRWFGRTLLIVGGWRMTGEFPDLPRVVLIAAPHSSNWDGVWGFSAKLAMGLDVRILGKDSLFRVPVLGWLLPRFGVIPVNRSAARGVVEHAVGMLGASERLWFALAPEGTRKPVERWKTGFWKIANAANVPVLPVYFHYPQRRIVVAAVFQTGDDMDADIQQIRAWYREVSKGKLHDA